MGFGEPHTLRAELRDARRVARFATAAMHLFRDALGWWTWHRHNRWWLRWTCPTCMRWAREDRRRESKW